MLRLKWLIYTVIVGLIPILARLMVYFLAPDAAKSFMWSATDISAFGLVLNISNINAVENEDVDAQWRTWCNGLSVMHVVFITGLFILSFTTELQPGFLDTSRLIQVAVLLGCTSFILGLTVYNRLSQATL
jgi:hypothetical protein